MDQAVRFDGRAELEDADSGDLGHPDLALYDAARQIFVETGLSPEPPVYEVIWLHLRGEDAALSRDVERAMEAGRLTRATVLDLRKSHLGEIAAGEMHDMVAAAHGAAQKLAERLESGRDEIARHDRVILAEDDLLAAGSISPAEILACIKRLRAANARVLAANRRLEADLEHVSRENSLLLERLETAERKAKTDPLTGLLNRRGMIEALQQALAAAQASGAPLSVALIDIDHFKQINDQWGHAIGDEVLRYLGSFLTHCLKKADGGMAGRFGGEEFVLILPGVALAAACKAVDSIRAALARQVMRRASDGARLGKVAFSAGFAHARPGDTVELLLDRADAAVYTAKRAGRDRVLPERAELH
ncbi:MAG: diguanylate cyclase [Thermaurantiacus tibetensis]